MHSNDILDTEYHERIRPGWDLKIAGLFMLWQFIRMCLSTYQSMMADFDPRMLFSIVILMLPLIGGIGLLTNKAYGWYLSILSLIFKIGASVFLLVHTFDRVSRMGLAALPVFAFDIIGLIILMILFRKQNLDGLGIHRYARFGVPAAGILILVVFSLFDN